MLSEDIFKKILTKIDENDWAEIFEMAKTIEEKINKNFSSEIETIVRILKKAGVFPDDFDPKADLQTQIQQMTNAYEKVTYGSDAPFLKKETTSSSSGLKTDAEKKDEGVDPDGFEAKLKADREALDRLFPLGDDEFPELDEATHATMLEQFSKTDVKRYIDLNNIFHLVRGEVVPELHKEYELLKKRYHELNRRFGTENCLKFALLNMDISEVRNNNLQ